MLARQTTAGSIDNQIASNGSKVSKSLENTFLMLRVRRKTDVKDGVTD